MSILIDLIGAVVIGGLLMLAIFHSEANVQKFTMKNQMDLVSEENLTTMLTMVDSDLRKIGYGWLNPNTAIISYDSTSIEFHADIDNNGTPDDVHISVGTTSQMGGTVNPRDFKLIRSVNGQQTTAALGLTSFKLKYYNDTGGPATSPATIKGIDVSLRAEGVFPVDTTYAWIALEGRIYPLNLAYGP